MSDNAENKGDKANQPAASDNNVAEETKGAAAAQPASRPTDVASRPTRAT